MCEFVSVSDYVYPMQLDLYKLGYVIYTDKYSLMTSNGNKTRQLIAGKSSETTKEVLVMRPGSATYTDL